MFSQYYKIKLIRYKVFTSFCINEKTRYFQTALLRFCKRNLEHFLENVDRFRDEQGETLHQERCTMDERNMGR